MKHIYLSLLIVFGFTFIDAQECPDGGTTSLGGTQILLSYTSVETSCVDRPATIVVNGTTTYELDPFSCSEGFSAYNKTSGPANPGQDFMITSGFDTACTYNEGTLPVEEFILNKTLSIFPNPVTKGHDLALTFGLPITGKIALYNITGKSVLQVNIDNKQKCEMNLSNLTNGVYMLKVATQRAQIMRKIVVAQ